MNLKGYSKEEFSCRSKDAVGSGSLAKKCLGSLSGSLKALGCICELTAS